VHAQLRALAEQDLADAVAYHRHEAGPETALGFVDAIEAEIADLCDQPSMGSLRFAFGLDIPDMRSWPVRGFPYLVFYVPYGDRLDIWRVLHAQRDILALLDTDLPG
jgi:toxin ParE1/3/4